MTSRTKIAAHAGARHVPRRHRRGVSAALTLPLCVGWREAIPTRIVPPVPGLEGWERTALGRAAADAADFAATPFVALHNSPRKRRPSLCGLINGSRLSLRPIFCHFLPSDTWRRAAVCCYKRDTAHAIAIDP